jgi:hypothetical protein
MTLVEILLALALSGFVGSMVVGIVVTQQRVHRANVARFHRLATFRDAAALFPSELQELNPSDTLDTDLELLGPSTVVYKAMRSVRFLCRPADLARLEVTTSRPWLGLRDIDPGVDSVLIFAGGDIASKADDIWLHADAVVVSGGSCPGGVPGLKIALRGVTASRLAEVHVGAPVRGYVVAEIGAYRDARGMWWAGMRRYQKTSGRWPARQPLFGPLEPSGLHFEVYGEDGAVAANVARATYLGVRVTPLGTSSMGGAGLPFPEILIAFRNRGH